MIRPSSDYIEILKQLEGNMPDFGGYYDVTGKWTEGYGDTLNRGKPTKTKEDADRRLKENIALFESELANLIKNNSLTQGQQNAVFDMAYNLGTEKFRKTGIPKLINEGKLDEVYEKIGLYTKAKNKKTGKLEDFPGLVDRAKKRQEWWTQDNLQPTMETGENGELIMTTPEYYRDLQKLADLRSDPNVPLYYSDDNINIVADFVKKKAEEEKKKPSSKDIVTKALAGDSLALRKDRMPEAMLEQYMQKQNPFSRFDPLAKDFPVAKEETSPLELVKDRVKRQREDKLLTEEMYQKDRAFAILLKNLENETARLDNSLKSDQDRAFNDKVKMVMEALQIQDAAIQQDMNMKAKDKLKSKQELLSKVKQLTQMLVDRNFDVVPSN